MTPQEQVVADATTTLQDACIAAGVSSPMVELTAAQKSLADAATTIADLRTQLTTATDTITTLQTQIVAAQATKANVDNFLSAFDKLRT